jgi:hypothetical protein
MKSKTISKLIAVLVLLLAFTPSVKAQTLVGTTQYFGKTWYVNVINQNGTGHVWFNQVQDASTDGDFEVMAVTVSNPNTDFLPQICRLKSVIDDGKTIVGCLATIGSGVCAIGAVDTGGATIFVCESVWAYTKSAGLADCVDGLADKLAGVLGIEKEWTQGGIVSNIGGGEIKEAISKSIDLMCQDVKAHAN